MSPAALDYIFLCTLSHVPVQNPKPAGAKPVSVNMGGGRMGGFNRGAGGMGGGFDNGMGSMAEMSTMGGMGNMGMGGMGAMGGYGMGEHLHPWTVWSSHHVYLSVRVLDAHTKSHVSTASTSACLLKSVCWTVSVGPVLKAHQASMCVHSCTDLA